MYMVYLAKIAKIPIFQHLIIWLEVAGTIIFHRKGVLWVYLKLSETILHYKSAFHGDSHIFEKNRFFESQNLAYKRKIANFTKNSCLNQMIVLLEDTSIWSPQTPLESTFPPLLPTCMPCFKIFEKFFENVNFLSFFGIKLNFHFYFPKLFTSKSIYSELSNALSNVLLSQKLTEIRAFKVMFRNLVPV